MSYIRNNEIKDLSFLHDLSEEQKSAVVYNDSPQLVLSGAGSGKTKVLISKIAYLIKALDIPPYNILAITFTKKAAKEMRDRISRLIGGEYSKKINMGTFHSIFLKILRENISFLKHKKYKSNFQIIDESEVKKIIKNILLEQFSDVLNEIFQKKNINDKVKSYLELKNLIHRIIKKIMWLKCEGITYKDYQKMEKEIENDEKRGMAFFKSIYRAYVKECIRKNVMDFEDLIINTLYLFKENARILEKYQKKFKYILIDEYQDTNRTQYEIIKALAWKSHKICGVGDDYQSIYSFRGSDIKNIDNFSKAFKDSKIFKLCQNYRSNSTIVKIADLLIKNNQNQIKKDLFSNIKEIDGKVNILINETGINECENISEIIKQLINDGKCAYKDIAILYRMNIQSYPFLKIFFKKNIPHTINNRITFYETKVIQNIFYYLKFIINLNLNSDCYLKNIINYPPRGIDEHIQNKLFSIAKANNINAWDIIKNCEDKEFIQKYSIDRNMKHKLLPFKKLILKLISTVNNKRVYGIVSELIESLELKKYLRNDPSSLEKVNNLLEKIEEMEDEYVQFSYSLEKYTLKEFLEQISVFMGNEEDNNDNKVKLMTIHQAKGLEFEYVFVVGLEEGFYPIYASNFDDEEIEEERRILYVAITRAKTNCYLSYAKLRQIGETESERSVSRFLNEIYNEDLVQFCQPPLKKENPEKNDDKVKQYKEENNNKNSIENNNKHLISNQKDYKTKKNIKIENQSVNDNINNKIMPINEKEETNNNNNMKKSNNKKAKEQNKNENIINDIKTDFNIKENNFENKMLNKKRKK